MTNILGIDYGGKRIGLALCAGRETPKRLSTIENDSDTLGKLEKIVDEYRVTSVVVGLPRNLEGEDTTQTVAVRGFADRLKEKLHLVRIELQDEALTSQEALKRLGAANADPKLVDQEAAVIILEDYIAENKEAI